MRLKMVAAAAVVALSAAVPAVAAPKGLITSPVTTAMSCDNGTQFDATFDTTPGPGKKVNRLGLWTSYAKYGRWTATITNTTTGGLIANNEIWGSTGDPYTQTAYSGPSINPAQWTGFDMPSGNSTVTISMIREVATTDANGNIVFVLDETCTSSSVVNAK